MDSKRGEHINLGIAWLEDDYRGGVSRYLDNQLSRSPSTYLVAKCINGRPRHVVAEVPSHHFLAFLVHKEHSRSHLSGHALELSNKHL